MDLSEVGKPVLNQPTVTFSGFRLDPKQIIKNGERLRILIGGRTILSKPFTGIPDGCVVEMDLNAAFNVIPKPV